MDPLTVAVDVAPLHGHRTGVGTAVAGMVDALVRRDDVALLPYLVSFRARPSAGERRLPLPAELAMRLWSASGHPHADRWLRGAAIVHGTNYVAPPTRLPTVVSVYDCWFLAHPEQASPAVRRAARVLRRAVARGAWVHVSSHATARAAKQLLGTDRVVTVPLGLPLGPPAEPPGESDGSIGAPRPDASGAGMRDVLFVGTLERRKDVPTLVRAFGRVAPGRRDVRLVLVGRPGDDHGRVAAALDELPRSVADRVVLAGAVDDATKAGLLRTAAVLAYPSLDEGFGFPILEAHAASVPVVATRAGSIPEVAGDAADLVDVGDVDALAGALARVLDEPEHAARLVAAGRVNLGRFSWDAAADGMVQLYRVALAAGGSTGVEP